MLRRLLRILGRRTFLKSLAVDHGKTVIIVSHDPKTVEVFPTVHARRDRRFVSVNG